LIHYPIFQKYTKLPEYRNCDNENGCELIC
jgi:hypothetical protein